MAKPDLKLVDVDLSDCCGATTRNGSPCLRRTGGEKCHDHREAPEPDLPPPEHLGELGREEWVRRVEWLEDAGALDQVDKGLLEAACEAYEEARRCRAVVEEHGRLIPGRTGMKKNPAHAKMLKFRKEYRLTVESILKSVDVTPKPDASDSPYSF